MSFQSTTWKHMKLYMGPPHNVQKGRGIAWEGWAATYTELVTLSFTASNDLSGKEHFQ